MAILRAVNRIRDLRLERAKTFPTLFTAASLAARISVTETTLLRWERGESRPHARHLRQLAKELGVTVEELELNADADRD
jgi:transcriptional regulator with XRE-family HTH domain